MKEEFEEVQVIDFKKPKKTKVKADTSTHLLIEASQLARSRKNLRRRWTTKNGMRSC